VCVIPSFATATPMLRQGQFTVHDTRRAAHTTWQHESDLSEENAAIRASNAPSRAKLQHQAMTTGYPSWVPPPTVPVDRADCRMVDIAVNQDNKFTRATTWQHSWTSRLGLHPHRPSFADRIHSLLQLVGEAYRLQRGMFDRLQRQYTKQAASVGIDCIPDDVMLFEFNLPWKELRHEIHSMLCDHVAALKTLQTAVPGSPEYQSANAISQRTSPETLVLALSGMSMFDAHKWGADSCPYDETEYELALSAAKASRSESQRAQNCISSSKHVDPAEDQLAYHASPFKSSAMSPATEHATGSTNSSFFSAGHHCASAASAGDSRQGTPTPDDAAPPAASASDNASFAKIPSIEDMDHAGGNDTDDAVSDGITSPPTGATVTRSVSPPPRPASIAACLNPIDVQERQAASIAYRTQVLHSTIAWSRRQSPLA